jgi:hypothetical protein
MVAYEMLHDEEIYYVNMFFGNIHGFAIGILLNPYKQTHKFGMEWNYNPVRTFFSTYLSIVA